MSTHAERIASAVALQEELTEKLRLILHSDATTTIPTDAGPAPSVAKLVADIAAQVIGGYNAGYVQNVANAAGRAAAVPAVAGQLLLQRDTQDLYYATGTSAGNWTLHPAMAGVQAATDLDTLSDVVDQKMDLSTYDPGGLGFAKGALDVQLFTASGTWTRPEGVIHKVELLLIGGGGGGGSGRRGAASTSRFGGGGGAAGAYVRLAIHPLAPMMAGGSIASLWDHSTLKVYVGAGGTGGAAIATDSANGLNGENGTNTYITNPLEDTVGAALVVARGGGGGGGGTSSAGAAGAVVALSSVYYADPETTGAGGTGGTSGPGAGGFSSKFLSPGGGGGGGGITSGNAGAAAGGPGGAPIAMSGILPSGMPSIFQPSLSYGGSGGAGGTSAASVSVHATDGTDGAAFGGGGGGGGAGVNGGASSGAGGDGADGICIIITQRY